ncbi:hypothetical protein ACOSQ2_000893 [Xanthoceras sorbifolium]
MGFFLSFIKHEWHKETLMGSIKQSGHIVSVLIFSLLLYSSMAQSSSNSYDPESLEALHHTGYLYNISLPSNFTTVQVSVVRIRSGTFWARGANFSFFRIPTRVIARPYTKRIAIVYDNLGNLSSHYYQVPNHSLVAPVVGFIGYDASNLSALGNEKLTFSVMGDPILISFPQIVLEDKNVTPKCVKFGADGSVEFSNMTQPNICATQGSGHFSVVMASPPPEKEEKHWKRWVVGFVGGFFGLILFIVVGVAVFMVMRKKKIIEMENETEKGVAFDTLWIGRSRLPAASMMRTQPVLEHDYVA